MQKGRVLDEKIFGFVRNGFNGSANVSPQEKDVVSAAVRDFRISVVGGPDLPRSADKDIELFLERLPEKTPFVAVRALKDNHLTDGILCLTKESIIFAKAPALGKIGKAAFEVMPRDQMSVSPVYPDGPLRPNLRIMHHSGTQSPTYYSVPSRKLDVFVNWALADARRQPSGPVF